MRAGVVPRAEPFVGELRRRQTGGKAPGPAQQAIGRDLLNRVYELMDPEVRQIANCRIEGSEWEEIASRLGGTADARRKQFRRAMDHIAQTLEIE